MFCVMSCPEGAYQSCCGDGDGALQPSEIETSKGGEDIVIFSILRDSNCSECGVELWKGNFLKMEKDRPRASGPLDRIRGSGAGATGMFQ